MAKQGGPIIWEMTICGISFYKRCGLGYVRMKSNLTRKRWQTDPAFAGSRKSASNMAVSAVLASRYYRNIPGEVRKYAYYHELVGISQKMLCAGFSIEQVAQVLSYTVNQFLEKLASTGNKTKLKRSSFSLNKIRQLQPAVAQPASFNGANENAQFPCAQTPVCIMLPSITASSRGQPPNRSTSKKEHAASYNTKAITPAGTLMCVPFETLALAYKTAA